MNHTHSLNPRVSRDLVPLAVASVGFAIMLGTAVMAVFLLLNRSLVLDLPISPTARPDVNQPAATLLLVGVMCTLVVPMVAAWLLLAPIDVTYRRFGFAMVSGFGALLVSVVSVPLNEWFGMSGLMGLLALSLIGALLLGRKARRERSIL